MDDKSSLDTASDDDSMKMEDADTKQFLTFRVANEEYGVELMTIREIKGWTTPTTLPNSPNFMKGVINLRGVVIPIFDLRHRFDMGQTDPDEKNVVIIIAVGEKLIGVLVDAVSDILAVTEDQIKTAPSVESKIDKEFIQGLISVDEKMVVILDIERLFDAETLAQADRVSSSNSVAVSNKKSEENETTNKADETVQDEVVENEETNLETEEQNTKEEETENES